MSLTIEHSTVPDLLAKQNAYSAAYRAAGSTRYRDFGDSDPRDPASYLERANLLQKQWGGNRKDLQACLQNELARFSPPEEVLENLAALGDEKTFIIAAGHQPALGGGPLFLAFKLLGVIRLAEQLTAVGDCKFIPLYWNGSEDHNPDEFSRLSVFDTNHDLHHLNLSDLPDGQMAHAISAKGMDELFAELAAALPDTEFKADLLADLKVAAQGNLGEMQTRLILKWFGRYGLVVIEPYMLRNLAAPILTKALKEREAIHAALQADTEAVRDMGYTPALPVPELARTLVYKIIDGARYRLRETEAGFTLENEDSAAPVSPATLYNELESHPEYFSPSAALRPVVQSAVLPVVAYLAGSGELRYHLQLRSIFKLFDATLPILLPRPAGTILKKSLLKTAKKLALEMSDLLAPGWEWEGIEARFQPHLAAQTEAFAQFTAATNVQVEQLGEALTQAGITNLNELLREQDKFLGRIEGLDRRLREQNPALGTAARKQYHRLRKFVLPAESYQDLSIWLVYFLALFGEELLPALLEKLDPLCPDHNVYVIG